MEKSNVVIIGGGVYGTSIAYHLAVMGCTDVILLEKDSLASGSSGKGRGHGHRTLQHQPFLGRPHLQIGLRAFPHAGVNAILYLTIASKEEFGMDKGTKDLVKYMVARYRLGYKMLALYLAVPLFDFLIDSKLERQDAEQFREIISDTEQNNLSNKINKLKSTTMENHHEYARVHILRYSGISDLPKAIDKLHKFRKFRNDLVHDGYRSVRRAGKVDNLGEEFIIYLWGELSHGTFTQAYKKTQRPITVDDMLEEIRADYRVRQGDHSFKEAKPPQGDFCAILESDFESLFHLRDQMERLKNALSGWLNQHRMATTTLTTVDTATAYVWMPMVKYSYHKKEEIPHIKRASVCILGTPLDLRIYLNFGGDAISDCWKFYNFLETTEYRDYINQLEDNVYSGAHELKIFNTVWYTFIEGEAKAATEIDQQDFRCSVASAKRKLEDTDKPKTWHRLLHGYIIKKEEVPAGGITIDCIKAKLESIIELYARFLRYSKNTR